MPQYLDFGRAAIEQIGFSRPDPGAALPERENVMPPDGVSGGIT